MFNALLVSRKNQKTIVKVEKIDESRLPMGNVTVAVRYSSLNYKDGLAVTGKGNIIDYFPMIPGIDFSGRVLSSEDKRYVVGDDVILTGWGVGEKHWGGFAEKARVSGDWLVPMPAGFSARKSMIVGTAGLTAMLCIDALQNNGIKPNDGKVVVTGASGGVGTIAVALLSQMGYKVVAVTGRLEQNAKLLNDLGAETIIAREELSVAAKPLEKARFAGAIDTVGGKILAKILTQIQYGGTVTACGLVASMSLSTTVMPFILRGVKLIGIDSVKCLRQLRIDAWNNIAKLLPDSYYHNACQEIGLSEVYKASQNIIDGKVTGRTLIKL